MKRIPCCAAPRRRRVAGRAGVVISGATLVLMPKCPVCVAAYVALLTGVSLSTVAATHLRTVVLILCAAVILVLLSIWLWGNHPRRHASRRGDPS